MIGRKESEENKRPKAKAGRRHSDYVYAGYDKGEELPRIEIKCRFSEGVGAASMLLAEIVRQAADGLSEGNREAVKKRVLETAAEELGKV